MQFTENFAFLLFFPFSVTGAPMMGSPTVVSPMVTLKHGLGNIKGAVQPKQEVVQKKEEEVGN